MASRSINRTYKVIKADPVRVKPNYKTKLKTTLAVGTTFTATKINGFYVYVPKLKGWTIWKSSKGEKYVKLVSNNDKTKGEKLCDAMKEISAQMLKAKVKYNNNSPCTNLASCLKKKRTNCATFVSYGLQKVGALSTKKYIWLSTKVHGSGAKAIKKKATVTYPKKTWKSANLRKGDVCGFSNKPHTMVYAGKSKHGYPLWYSCGSSDIKAKNLGAKRKKSYEKRKIYVKIRLK